MNEPPSWEKSSFCDLSDRAKFHIRGTDRLRFLNGQMTNDVRKATETNTIEACVLSAKGKMDAHIFVSAQPDLYQLDADGAQRETLPARLERYLIADDVKIDDVSDEFGLFHLLISEIPELPNEWRAIPAQRFLRSGWDVWIKKSEHDQAHDFFLNHWPICDASCAESVRIEAGIPRWGQELTAEIIPIEANLEERCVDYYKGCYVGQEVISRIKMSGQTNKRLCGLVAKGVAPLLPATRLTTTWDESRDVGWITSSDHNQRLQKFIGLGLVKRGFNTPGTQLRMAGSLVEVVPLPFV